MGKKFLFKKTYDEFWHWLILDLFFEHLVIQWKSKEISKDPRGRWKRTYGWHQQYISSKFGWYREFSCGRNSDIDQEHIQHTPIEFSSKMDSVSYFEPKTYNMTSNTSNITSNISDYNLQSHNNIHHDIPNEPRRSNCKWKSNLKYTSVKWAHLVTSINEEKIPWSMYGDRSMFLPESKGIKAVLQLKHTEQIVESCN